MVSFGSSGIRGPYGSAITPDLALRLGRALGGLRRRVLVGRDARLTGPTLEAAVVAGLLASGAEVSLGGVAPTPAVAYAGRAFDAGLVITASHNPAPDNGFKLWDPDGKAFDAAARRALTDALEAPSAAAPWAGLHEPVHHPSVVRDHADAVVDAVGELPRRLKVVLDAGNGAGGVETPGILRRLGADVVTLNAQPDGAFPGRPSEPTEANLAALREAVVATGADVGLAHDGDADRCVAVTAAGRVVSGDALAALFARESGAERIVVPVDMSMLMDDALDGVDVVRTRVGDAYVSEAVLEHDAQWGGEASGAWIFPRVRGADGAHRRMTLCPDGPLAAALVARLVARGAPLEDQVTALPSYPIDRASVAVPEARKADVVAEVARALESKGDVTTVDGARVHLGDGWVLVRASGTEPKVRVTAEARDAARMKEYLAMGVGLVEAAAAGR